MGYRKRKFSKYRKYKRRRFGGKAKFGYRKMRRRSGMVYRTGGNFASKQPTMELKVLDLAINPASADPDPYNNNQALANWVPQAATTWGVAGSGPTKNGGSFFGFSQTGGVLSAAGQTNGDNAVCLNAPCQSPDINGRIGRRIQVRSLTARISVTCPSSWTVGPQVGGPQSLQATVTAGSSTNTRLMLVLDKQSNGQMPIKGDVLQQVGASGGVALSPFLSTDAMNNLSNRNRFVVLYDKTVCLDGIAKKTHTFVFHKKMNIPVTFNANNSSIVAGWAQIGTNGIWMFGVSDRSAAAASTGAAAPPVNIPLASTGSVRMRYTDC